MATFEWNADEFEFEAIDEMELLDSQLEVLDGLANAPSDATNDALEDSLTETEIVEAELRAEALESQATADAAVSVGDYEAAAYHQGLAESAADTLGDASLLDGPTALELQVADEHQDRAMELETQQAEAAQNGDYAAARDLAAEAAYEHKASDQLAGGADHSGQAELEVANMEWADWHQQISNDMLTNALDYASEGDLGRAESYLDGAVNHGAVAEHYGDLGEHGGPLAATDPAAPIESHHYDTYTPEATATSTTDDSAATTTSDTNAVDDATT